MKTSFHLRSPVFGLVLEMWRRNGRTASLVAGIFGFGLLLNLVISHRLQLTTNGPLLLTFIDGMLTVCSVLIVFGIFNYTEFNSGREWHGFPYRLFVLPVRTWVLVACPMVLGAASVMLVFVAWAKFVFAPGQIEKPGWFAVVLGTFMLCYQCILWCLAGFRIARLVVLSLAGALFVGVATLPWSKDESPWAGEKRLSLILAGVAMAAYFVAWFSVSRQRCGGGHRRSWLTAMIDRALDALPRRRRPFRSPAAAHFWFEWRRSGWLLPFCVGFMLLAIFGPVTWFTRGNSGSTMWTLGWVMAMPLLLAVPIGKGFSKPEFWNQDLALVPFLAVRPLSSGEMVVTKLKVAALAVVLAWGLVLLFVGLWLPLWADRTQLTYVLIYLVLTYPHTHLVIVGLAIVAALLVTWRFMVGSLWAGLSGRRNYFLGAIGMQVMLVGLFTAGSIWVDAHGDSAATPEIVVSFLGWALAGAVVLKLWLAVLSWSRITARRTWLYLLFWLGGTGGMVYLVHLAMPIDTFRFEHLWVLLAMLVIPLTQLGWAPAALEKNRHR